MCPTDSNPSDKTPERHKSQTPPDHRDGLSLQQAQRRLLILTAETAVVIASVSWFRGGVGNPVDGNSLRMIVATLWIGAQSVWVTLPALAIGWLIARWWPRAGWRTGAVALGITASVVVLDVVAHAWIDEAFLSDSVLAVLSQFGDRLSRHVSAVTAWTGLAMFAACLLAWSTAWFVARRLADRWRQASRNRSPRQVMAIAIVACLVLSLPAWIDRKATTVAMRSDATRHPFAVFRLVDRSGVRMPVPPAAELYAAEDPAAEPSTSAPTTAQSQAFADAIAARDRSQRLLSANLAPDIAAARPDVLIVVIESFRPELVTEEGMPNLHAVARSGIHCRQHFSGGNATNHGMFSLVNGLEAVWHERDIRFAPMLNRILRQAGYELGFFGGHDDWREFLMDGFISEKQFDRFEIEPKNWLLSDHRATQRASQFLRRESGQDHPPRLALLYLYSTHANYHSYDRDRIFGPAADDRFLIPFGQGMREKVWNRYRNSGRSLDRLLSAVMTESRVVVVTGDHGESFLEDGVCGHGTRVSRYQNMTPAVIAAPGLNPRLIDQPTMHADLLPTLLELLKIPVSDSREFDGIDLSSASLADLSGRVFATRNYLTDDVGLIGPWTVDPDQPFAFRAAVRLNSAQAIPLDAIDQAGRAVEGSGEACQAALRRWRDLRFGLP